MLRRRGAIVCLLAVLLAAPAAAGEISKSYEFALHDWHPIEESDGAVTLHRVRIDPKEGRWTKSAIARPYNQEYLQTLLIQLEYTNESTRKWKARVTAQWLDEEGMVIDGFSANESLGKKSARDVVQMSVSTLKYGVEKAKTLEVTVHFTP